MKAMRIVALLVVLIAVAWSSALAQTVATLKGDDGPVVLHYHFHANDVRNVKMVMEQKIKQVIQGQEMTMNQTIGMGYRINILSVDEKGNATAKLTYKSVRVKMENPAMNVDYDSTQAGATVPTGAESFAGLLNETIDMKFAPDGQVLQVDGVDAMIKHVIGKAGANNDPDGAMAKSLKSQFGDKAMKQMLEQLTRIYPDHAVKVGDSWAQHAEIEAGIALVMDSKYTLAGRTKGVATVAISTVCKTNPKAAPLDLGQFKIGYDLGGQQDGTMSVDEASGWLLRMKMTQKLAGKMHMEGPQLPEAMTVPITIESTVTATTE